MWYIVYNFVLMKNDTIVSVIICFINETMTFITMTLICFRFCDDNVLYLMFVFMIYANFKWIVVYMYLWLLDANIGILLMFAPL